VDTKLTLRLKKRIIDQAKAYAKANGTSLSSMVEQYFDGIASPMKAAGEDAITPFVKSLSMPLDLPADFDERAAYRDHLAKKYK
jgi:hypothetical protein